MSDAPEATITQLLRRWSEGDEAVPEVLLPRVYDELRAIAERSFRREAAGHTLQATAVVHEAYLNLTRGAPVEWRDRSHFFGIMARIMRQVLVDHARRRNRLKRGGGLDRSGTVDELAADAAAGPFLEGGAFGTGVQQLTGDVADAPALSPDGAAVRSPLGDGAIVDHFRILRRIGYGATGAVYVARDLQLGRRLALKVIDPTLIGSTAARQRFLREARTTARFNHPNIVTIHAVGECAGRLYLALEYLEGRTLAERLADHSLGRGEMLRIAVAIADALAEAHRHGVLQRDLKPSNVVITRDGATRVLDFGIATCLASEDGLRSSPTEQDRDGSSGYEVRGDGGSRWFGTPAAMAPEQWAHGPITPAVDVWALGMILLEHLVGERPWQGLTAAAIGARVMRDEARAVLAAATLDPPEPALRQLLERCLDPDPLARPTAVVLGEALADILLDRHTALASERAPFRGLLPWQELDHHWFCGRAAEIDALVERLNVEPVVVLAGPSGAGKSSLIQAGIVPRLRRCGRWEVVAIRPGTEPLRTLLDRIPLPVETGVGVASGEAAVPPPGPVARLLRHPGLLAVGLAHRAERAGVRVLLVIDQLEELFTLGSDEATRRGFMAAVLAAADDPAAPVRALLCVRQDYLGELARVAPAAAVTGRIAVVSVPGPEALRETLTTPVAAAGYAWDPPTLVDEMVTAVAGNPAALSLLQFVGLAMWRDRDPAARTLPALSYHNLGGAVGALARHADGVLDALGPSHAAIAREILPRPTGMVGSCAIRPDGRRVVGADVDDPRIVEWDVASGRMVHASPLLDVAPFALDYSGDGRAVVASLADGRVVEWRTGDHSLRTLATVPGRPYWLRAAPVGDIVAVPVSDGSVRLVGDDARELVLNGHRGEVNRVAFGPRGVMVASAGDDGTVRLWRTDTGRPAWYCPLMMAGSGVLYSHQGWCDPDGVAVADPPLPTGARRAVEHGVAEGLQLARVDDGGTTLCLAAAREVRLWDLTEDRELVRTTLGAIRQLEARRRGCVAVTETGALALLEAGGQLQAIGDGVDAAAVRDDEILAVGSGIGVVAWTGDEMTTLRSEPVEGATAVLRVAAGVLVGFRDGTVELAVAGHEGAQRWSRLEALVPAAVERLAAAPADTVAVGFANGEVGVWSLASGARLLAAHLHGPVVHLAAAGDTVTAATELGDATVFDLTTLQLGRCEVLRRMWADVPVVWEAGSAVLRPPPSRHECAVPRAGGDHSGGG